jgi:hypothetical protein
LVVIAGFAAWSELYKNVRLVCKHWHACARSLFDVQGSKFRDARREIGFLRDEPTRKRLPGEETASGPFNPKCILSRAGCSRNLLDGKPGLCTWHAVRMANVEPGACSCGKYWVTVCGDHTGRHLRMDLIARVVNQPRDTLIWDGVDLYCCGFAKNTDQCPFRCGRVRVCCSCVKKHKHNK